MLTACGRWVDWLITLMLVKWRAFRHQKALDIVSCAGSCCMKSDGCSDTRASLALVKDGQGREAPEYYCPEHLAEYLELDRKVLARAVVVLLNDHAPALDRRFTHDDVERACHVLNGIVEHRQELLAKEAVNLLKKPTVQALAEMKRHS